MSTPPWQEAFLGVAALLEVPIEEAIAALPADSALASSEAARGLRDPSRRARAHAMARALGPVAIDLEEMRLA